MWETGDAQDLTRLGPEDWRICKKTCFGTNIISTKHFAVAFFFRIMTVRGIVRLKLQPTSEEKDEDIEVVLRATDRQDNPS